MAGYFQEAGAKLKLDITEVEKNLQKAGVLFGQFGEKAKATTRDSAKEYEKFWKNALAARDQRQAQKAVETEKQLAGELQQIRESADAQAIASAKRRYSATKAIREKDLAETRTQAQQGGASSDSLGGQFGRVVRRKFSFGDAFKGLLAGVGIASVDAIADAIVRPFQLGADRAKDLVDLTKRIGEVTRNEIAVFGGAQAEMRLMKRELRDANRSIADQEKLVKELNDNPLNFVSQQGLAMLREAEGELNALKVKQAEVASQIRITNMLNVRQSGEIARNAIFAANLIQAEIGHATEIEKLEMRRLHLIRERRNLQREGASPVVISQNNAEQIAIGKQIELARKRQNEATADAKRDRAAAKALGEAQIRYASEREQYQIRYNALVAEYATLLERRAAPALLEANKAAREQLDIQIRLIEQTEGERVAAIGRQMYLGQKLNEIELRNGSEREKLQEKLNYLITEEGHLRRRNASASEIAENIRQQQETKGDLKNLNKKAKEDRQIAVVTIGQAAANTPRAFRNGAQKPRSETERIAQRGEGYLEKANDALLTGRPGDAKRYTQLANNDLAKAGGRIAATGAGIEKDSSKNGVTGQLISANKTLANIDKNLTPGAIK